MNEVKQAGEQAAALTAQLLAFSGKQILRPRAVSVDATLASMDQMIRSAAGSEVQVQVRKPQAESWIKIDPVQIQQVIMNLTVNARDAMPGGGKLTFDLHHLQLDDTKAAELGLQAGSYAMMAVSDTGCGMPPDVIRRVFEPFFTTKSMGRGTGLGLATVHGIVEQSGGCIRIESEPQAGTTFSIWFPRCDAAANAGRVENSAIAKGHETVLLVEDDPGVRRLAHEVLSGAGYRVLVAEGGEVALSLAREHASQIALLITDMCLPGTNGADVADSIRVVCPRIKCLFVSGFTEVALEANTPSLPPPEFLPKPYTPFELCERVGAILSVRDQPKRILVVDDEKPILRLMQEILEGAGYEVMTAQNGREAMKRMRAERVIDLVITDLVMPEMEGMEFISAMKKERPNLKIVATTGGAYFDYLQVASLLGAHATLPKPVTPDLVLDCVRNLTN